MPLNRRASSSKFNASRFLRFIKPNRKTRDMLCITDAKLAFMRERSCGNSFGRAPGGIVVGGSIRTDSNVLFVLARPATCPKHLSFVGIEDLVSGSGAQLSTCQNARFSE